MRVLFRFGHGHSALSQTTRVCVGFLSIGAEVFATHRERESLINIYTTRVYDIDLRVFGAECFVT